MRVISGFLKGREIKGHNLEGTRPTMDRVKQSMFAMIQDDIKESICLDLFAGSGSLGIEAISNGASFCYFIDKNKVPFETIKYNLNNFNIANQSKVMLMDYKKALTFFKESNIKFNLIFLDPPYQGKMIDDILNYIDENNLLYPSGQVICEYSSDQLNDNYGRLSIIKERRYGDKMVRIYIND